MGERESVSERDRDGRRLTERICEKSREGERRLKERTCERKTERVKERERVNV